MKKVLTALGVAIVIALAAPASADPPPNNDTDFLKQLTDAGLTYHDPAQAVAVAKEVCKLVDKGTSDTDIEKNLRLRNPSFSGNGAAKFMTLAAGEYCPKYLTGDGRPAKPPGAAGN